MHFDSTNLSELTFEGTIVSIDESNYTNKLTVKTNNTKAIIYLNKSFDVEVGNYGTFVCTKATDNSNTYNGSFDYEEYLNNSYIAGVYFCNEFYYSKNVFTLSKFQDSIKLYFESNLSGDTLDYCLMLILGLSSTSDKLDDTLSNLGIMHLFCISGMHINFILMVVSLILNKFRISSSKIEVVQIISAILLLIITNFSISVTRAFLMLFISFIFRRLKHKTNNLDVLCISAIIILLFKPRYIYLVSFQLSYLVTFMIIITKDFYKSNNVIRNSCIQSIVAFAVTFPIIININYEINFLTILYSTFISIPFSYVILPITFISGILKLNFFEPIFALFNNLLFDFSGIDIFTFSITKLNIIMIVIYYIIIFLILKSIYTKKYIYRKIIYLIVFLFIAINNTTLNNVTTVTFFNVGQGDSSLISLAYNKGNILIDAFGGVGNYIETLGINRIDYVIITHAHNDHMGDLEEIKNEYKVNNVVCSLYDQDSQKLGCDSYVSGGDRLVHQSLVFNFLAPYESHSDINRASLVFTVNINGYTFMYTGDTTKEVEYVMVEKGLNLKVDVLKVPHHGSSTSSSVEFVNATYPSYAIFSYGESNSYGLPNYEVINRYTMSENYHTAIHGHIEFYYKKKWYIRLFN